MDTQNVTLSLPKQVLRKAKLIAVERQTSLSGLLTQLLIDLVAQEDAYEKARLSHKALLEQGFDMGTGGTSTWTRDELHER